MIRRPLMVVLMATAVLVVVPDLALGASAHADRSAGSSLPLPLAFLGIHFPSVSSIVGGVVKLFFGALLKVLGVPVHGTAAALHWLIAVPDPTDQTQWPTVGRLEGDMQAVDVGLLPLTFTLTAVRYWLAGLSGQPTWSLEAVVRVTGAVAGLVAYSWAFGNVVAAVNVVTNAMLAFPAVQHGMTATVGVLFAGGLAGGGVLLAIIGLVLVFLAVALFFLKVLVLVVFGVLYVTGGALIFVSALPELHPLWRAWKLALGAAAMIPIGWCVLFALAGAFTADVTRLGGGFLTGKLVGALAALAIYAIALKWPLMVLGRAKMMLGPRALGTPGQPGTKDVTAARAALQSAALRAANATSEVLRGSTAAAGRGVIATGRGVPHAGARLPESAALAGGAGALAAVAGPVRSPLQQAAARVRDRGRAGSEQTAQTLAAGARSALPPAPTPRGSHPDEHRTTTAMGPMPDPSARRPARGSAPRAPAEANREPTETPTKQQQRAHKKARAKRDTRRAKDSRPRMLAARSSDSLGPAHERASSPTAPRTAATRGLRSRQTSIPAAICWGSRRRVTRRTALRAKERQRRKGHAPSPPLPRQRRNRPRDRRAAPGASGRIRRLPRRLRRLGRLGCRLMVAM